MIHRPLFERSIFMPVSINRKEVGGGSGEEE